MAFEPLTPERRRQQTREYLLEAAARVFAERGFHGASLDQVAAAAGFTKGAVYSNFKNKEDLFLALLEASREREMDALNATLEASDTPPGARLPDFVTFIEDQTTDLGDRWGILYQEFALYAMRNPAAREKLAEFDAQSIAEVADLIGAERARLGIEPLEKPEHVAKIIVALFHGITLMRALNADFVDESFLESAVTFLAQGLMPAPDDQTPAD
ncbi:MAG TPA: TetR/AcrR family transcriptional regulator [Acidimicrobiales bacterium]|nr:TetR/AcrR family transcriptional regulator [Acidimicrobiales bacterium]